MEDFRVKQQHFLQIEFNGEDMAFKVVMDCVKVSNDKKLFWYNRLK